MVIKKLKKELQKYCRRMVVELAKKVEDAAHTYIHIYIPKILKSHKTIGCGTCHKHTKNKNVAV
jgi:hypothetical protein